MKTPLSNQPKVETGYIPRLIQLEMHRNLRRFSVLVLHRRAGKTVFAINHLLDRAMRCSLPNPQYAFIAPTYAAAKRIAWTYLHTYTENIPDVEFNEADLRLILPHNKAKIMLLSAENYNNIRGIYLDGCVMDEVADMSPLVWQEAVRPTLSDRRGWCLFLGTPRGNNHFKELYDYATSGRNEEWYGRMFKASDTKIIAESELKSARDTMDENTYLQEYECSFSAGLVGAYFTKELDKASEEKRVGKFPYDPELPVNTGWDLGVSDTTAIWFYQNFRGVPRFIDYYEVGGLSIAEIVSDIQKKKYALGEHLIPHDARARDLSTGRSIEQLMYSLGLKRLRVIPRVGSKRDSINAARMLLPKACFDAEKCEKGLKALYNYRRKWNEKNSCFDDSPVHDWASNGSDAFQQVALGIREESGTFVVDNEVYRTEQLDQAETDYNPFA